MSIFDDEHSEEEERWITLGLDRAGVLLVVSHTFRKETGSGRFAIAQAASAGAATTQP